MSDGSLYEIYSASVHLNSIQIINIFLGKRTLNPEVLKCHENLITLDTYVQGKKWITRLLGRPQPQMYPPVALNQYTLVNRTHKHYIYMLQGPTNILKSHQSSTICKIFVFILGGPGEAYVESRGIKVS